MSLFREIIFPTEDTRYVRGKPRFKSREEAERHKTWAENKYRKKFVVVKNPFGNDFYYRVKK